MHRGLPITHGNDTIVYILFYSCILFICNLIYFTIFSWFFNGFKGVLLILHSQFIIILK